METFASALTGVAPAVLAAIARRLRADKMRGRPWALSLPQRIVIACTSLRTNLTVRELAAVFAISPAQAHRIVADIVQRLAALAASTPVPLDRRYSWIVDGTLVPTRDHQVAGKAKNYRWSCNAQLLIRRTDLRVIAVTGGGPGNRNDTIHYRGTNIEQLCQSHGRVLADGGYRGVPELVTPVFRGRHIVRDRRWRRHRRRRARVEHAIARLKDWRVLRDHRRRGRSVIHSLQAVAVLHNLKIELRNNS